MIYLCGAFYVLGAATFAMLISERVNQLQIKPLKYVAYVIFWPYLIAYSLIVVISKQIAGKWE